MQTLSSTEREKQKMSWCFILRAEARKTDAGHPTATPPALQYSRATSPGSRVNTELPSQSIPPSTPWFDYLLQPFGNTIRLGLHTARPVLPSGLPLFQTNHATPAALADMEKMAVWE